MQEKWKEYYTKDELKEGIKLSDIIELDKTGNKVRRKDNKPLPELVLLAKKRKTGELSNGKNNIVNKSKGWSRKNYNKYKFSSITCYIK